MHINKFSLALLFLLGMAATGAALAAAGDADFTLINRTGITIREIYVSPTARNQWGRDRLGDNTLSNGASRHFKFGDQASCRQDIKVVFEDDTPDTVWNNIDLCKVEKVTLRYDRKTKAVSAETE